MATPDTPDFQQSVNAEFSGPVTISGTVDVASLPNVTIAGGTVDIGSGTVSISGTPAVTVTSGTVAISGTPNVKVTSGTVSISGTPAVTVTSGTVAISSGTVSISGTPNVNIASGSVNIASGTVDIGTVGSIVDTNEIYSSTQAGTGNVAASSSATVDVSDYSSAIVYLSTGPTNASFGLITVQDQASGAQTYQDALYVEAAVTWYALIPCDGNELTVINSGSHQLSYIVIGTNRVVPPGKPTIGSTRSNTGTYASQGFGIQPSSQAYVAATDYPLISSFGLTWGNLFPGPAWLGFEVSSGGPKGFLCWQVAGNVQRVPVLDTAQGITASNGETFASGLVAIPAQVTDVVFRCITSGTGTVYAYAYPNW